MERIRIKLKGQTALLMHATTLANPTHPLKLQMDELTSKRKKTPEIHREIADLEFKAALYIDQKIGPYLPATMVRASLKAGAKLSRGGREIDRAVIPLADKFKLEYVGPRNIDGLMADDSFRDCRMVRVQRATLLRTRPKFEEWSCTVEFAYDPDRINKDVLIQWFEDAGRYEGVGDARTLAFGRYEVEEV